MVIQAIRRNKKRMRWPLIIMVVMLAVGLVGSFAIWSSPDLPSPGSDGGEINPEEQIKNFQLSIDSLEKDLTEKPEDFSILKSLGDIRAQQAGLYAQVNDQEKSIEVFKSALENYLAALDYAPGELNEQGQADILSQAAFCAANSDQDNLAHSFYQEAIKLMPEDLNVRNNYVFFLAFYRQDLAGAKAEMENYKALLKDGDERIIEADKVLDVLISLEDAAKEQEEKNEDSDKGKEAAPKE